MRGLIYIHVHVCTCSADLSLDDSCEEFPHLLQIVGSEAGGDAAVQQHDARLLRLLHQNVSRVKIPVDKIVNEQLQYVCRGAEGERERDDGGVRGRGREMMGGDYRINQQESSSPQAHHVQ